MPRLLIAGLAASVLLSASDGGVPPRASSSDYPVSRDAKAATIAAAVVRPERARKILGEAGKKFIVVEVAVFPRNGGTVTVSPRNFSLQVGADQVSYPASPREVAAVWEERDHPLPGGVNVRGTAVGTVSAGGDMGSGSPGPDGVSRRYPSGTRGWGAGQGVSVDNYPRQDPRPGTDIGPVEEKAGDLALPQGETTKPVAGYLYFAPPAKKAKTAPLELRYSNDGERLALPLPAK